MRTIWKQATQRLANIGAEHKRIARGFLLVSLFTLVGKFAGAIKEVAIAYRFGISEIVDVYVLAFTLAIWIPTTASTVLNSIYVPLIHKLETDEKEIFTRQFTGIGFITAGLITLLLLFLLPWSLDMLSGQFSDDLRQSLRTLGLGFAPLAGMAFLSALFSVLLLAEERHGNTLFQVIPPLTLLVLVLLWPTQGSIDPLLWGSLLGMSLQAIGLYFLLYQSRILRKPLFNFNSPGWRRFKQDIGIVFLGQFIMSFGEPISSVIAAELGPGNVAGLGYSNRVLALFLTLGATTISRAILPVLSKSQKQQQHQVRLGIQWSLIMFFAGLICAALTWIITPQLVKILLERGAFNADNTATVAAAIRLGVLQFPFFFSGIVLVQLFVSQRLYKPILWSSILAIFMKVSFSLMLVPSFNFGGIILANVPMYAATNILFAAILWKTQQANITTPK